MNKPNLLIYSDAHVLGGADRYLLNIVPALKNNWQISFFYRRDVEMKPVTDKLDQMGISCHKLAEPAFNIKNIIKLKQIFSKQKPDLIIFNQGSFYTSKAARLAAILAKIPQVVIQHGSTFEGKKFYSFANRLFGRLTFSKAKLMIVPSKSSAAFFSQKFSYLKNILVINHGIDLKVFKPESYSKLAIKKKLDITEKSQVLIYIGRLEDDKNAHELINLYEKIQLPNLYFLILGEGSLKKELEKQAKLKDFQKIKFLGKNEYPAQFLAASDILVQTSRSESFSLAVVEAMAMGVVPVAFKIDSLPAIIGEVKLTVPYPNFSEMAQTIKTVLTESQDRKRLSDSVRSRAVRLFNLEKMQGETMKALERLKNE